jgi:hypothetical protein
MRNPQEFFAQEGQEIAPLLARFARFVKRDSVITITGGARVMKTAQGRRVIYDPAPQTFPGAFKVRQLGGNRVEVSDGLVSGLVPYLDGRRLDGLDEEGEPLPEGRPSLLCEAPKTGDRTYVVLYARHTDEGEVDDTIEQDSGDPGAVIVHLEELPPGMREEGRVARLVAVLYWQGGQVRQVRQVVWYDQEVFPSGGKARMRAAS